MDTWIDPRDLVMDEPIAGTPGVRGETGLRLPRSRMPDNADPVEGAAHLGHLRSRRHLAPFRRKDGGDACHSVPDSPALDVNDYSGANFPGM